MIDQHTAALAGGMKYVQRWEQQFRTRPVFHLHADPEPHRAEGPALCGQSQPPDLGWLIRDPIVVERVCSRCRKAEARL